MSNEEAVAARQLQDALKTAGDILKNRKGKTHSNQELAKPTKQQEGSPSSRPLPQSGSEPSVNAIERTAVVTSPSFSADLQRTVEEAVRAEREKNQQTLRQLQNEHQKSIQAMRDRGTWLAKELDVKNERIDSLTSQLRQPSPSPTRHEHARSSVGGVGPATRAASLEHQVSFLTSEVLKREQTLEEQQQRFATAQRSIEQLEQQLEAKQQELTELLTRYDALSVESRSLRLDAVEQTRQYQTWLQQSRDESEAEKLLLHSQTESLHHEIGTLLTRVSSRDRITADVLALWGNRRAQLRHQFDLWRRWTSQKRLRKTLHLWSAQWDGWLSESTESLSSYLAEMIRCLHRASNQQFDALVEDLRTRSVAVEMLRAEVRSLREDLLETNQSPPSVSPPAKEAVSPPAAGSCSQERLSHSPPPPATRERSVVTFTEEVLLTPPSTHSKGHHGGDAGGQGGLSLEKSEGAFDPNDLGWGHHLGCQTDLRITASTASNTTARWACTPLPSASPASPPPPSKGLTDSQKKVISNTLKSLVDAHQREQTQLRDEWSSRLKASDCRWKARLALTLERQTMTLLRQRAFASWRVGAAQKRLRVVTDKSHETIERMQAQHVRLKNIATAALERAKEADQMLRLQNAANSSPPSSSS